MFWFLVCLSNGLDKVKAKQWEMQFPFFFFNHKLRQVL